MAPTKSWLSPRGLGWWCCEGATRPWAALLYYLSSAALFAATGRTATLALLFAATGHTRSTFAREADDWSSTFFGLVPAEEELRRRSV